MNIASGAKVLVVDNEIDTLELLVFIFRDAGYSVVTAASGAEAITRATTEFSDLIILDLTLPDMEGFNVCRSIRADPATRLVPIFILTGRNSEIDRVLAFELGANDYLVKPFSPRELLLRMKNLLARGVGHAQDAIDYRFGDLYIDVPAQRVILGRRDLSLTVTEFRLLTVLAKANGRVITREQLRSEVWRKEAGGDVRAIDTCVSRLRDKLGASADLVDTVHGVGYRMFASSTMNQELQRRSSRSLLIRRERSARAPRRNSVPEE